MAIDNRLQIFDENGNPVDYDIMATDVKFADGKDLPTKLDELENEIGESQGGYTPPEGGIPKTDLAPAVQQTLDDVAGKVDKVTGKGLSSNDYTDTDKGKVDGLKPVATSGSYNDLTDKPTIPTVPTMDSTPTAGNTTHTVSSDGVAAAISNSLPHIGENGHWWIGNTDTGISAQGLQGDTQILDPTTFDPVTQIINNVSDGGETDALSAEMGKVIRQNIVAIYNALGPYAFPNGKPTLNWGSTVIKHDISVSGVTGLSITGIEVDGESVAQMPSQIIDYKSLSFKMTKTASQIYRSVAISMGGTDITEDTGVWDESTGTVTIAHVTGDVVVAASSLTLVEYLQSDGNQWIDTGIIAAANFKSEIKADILSPADSSWRRLLGTSDANQRFAIAVGLQSTSGDGKLYSQFGTSGNTFITASSSVVTGLHTFITQLTGSALSFSVDGVSGNAETTAVNQITLPSLSLFMFSCHREDSVVQSITAKVYYCKIWNGNDLVFDAIPVRVGQVGYMYDRVSDTLLPNIGTGSFTLGNDKTA